MLKHRLGKKHLRLLIFVVLMIAMLCGCSDSKYEPVQPLEDISGVVNQAEVAAFTIAEPSETVSFENESLADAAAETETADDAIVYEEVHDWITVTADVLNVRAEDNTNARIYVQLKTGDVLERIGFHEEWSQVIYDGGVAYVATSMVEVTEEPETEEPTEPAESPETAEGMPGEPSALAEGDAEQPHNLEAGIETANAGAETAVKGTEDGIPVYEKTGVIKQEEAHIPWNGHTIAIDAGHQAKANAEKEPIGPASSTKKAKMPEGAVGAATGVKEYELTLTVAKKLETELKARGYQVVMIRTGHDVNLSNAERSKIANESEADIFIRLHANSMENSGIYGALAMCMTEQNPYNSELFADSYRLSKSIINNICSLTGTKNRGVQKVDNSAMINWCAIPVSVVEMGFLTNPDEDKWLQDEEYQGKIVEGIAKAVDSYFAVEE